MGDPGSIPGSGRSLGEGNGNPLQYPCLENSMDEGAWQATVHGVTKSQTQLSDFTLIHIYYHIFIQSPDNGHLACFHVLDIVYILLQWTLGFFYLFELRFSPDICPGVGLQDHIVALFLVFWGTFIWFTIVVVGSLLNKLYVYSYSSIAVQRNEEDFFIIRTTQRSIEQKKEQGKSLYVTLGEHQDKWKKREA